MTSREPYASRVGNGSRIEVVGSKMVGLFNRKRTTEEMTVTFSKIGIHGGGQHSRPLAHKGPWHVQRLLFHWIWSNLSESFYVLESAVRNGAGELQRTASSGWRHVAPVPEPQPSKAGMQRLWELGSTVIRVGPRGVGHRDFWLISTSRAGGFNDPDPIHFSSLLFVQLFLPHFTALPRT